MLLSVLFCFFPIVYLNEYNYKLVVCLLQAGNITIIFSFQLNGMVMLTFRWREKL